MCKTIPPIVKFWDQTFFELISRYKYLEIQIELGLSPNICTLEKKVDAVLGTLVLCLSLLLPFVGLVKTFFVAPFSAFHNVRAPAGY